MSGDNMIIFPLTWEEFENDYGFTDKEQVYTNGSRLIPSFRVEQWLEHIKASKLKGEWKNHKTKSNKQWYECTNCGWVHFQKSKYCPNCGAYMVADMRGKE